MAGGGSSRTSQMSSKFVAKARSGEQTGGRAVHFDQGVVRDRGAVDDRNDIPQEVGERTIASCRQLLEAVHHGQRAIGRGAEHLFEQDLLTVEQGKVGKRAADIDADAIAHVVAASLRCLLSLRSLLVSSQSITRSNASSDPLKLTP